MQGLRDGSQGLRQGLPQHPEPKSGHQVNLATFLDILYESLLLNHLLNSPEKRSVGELVQFYYLWKKTERHDVFANRYMQCNVH